MSGSGFLPGGRFPCTGQLRRQLPDLILRLNNFQSAGEVRAHRIFRNDHRVIWSVALEFSMFSTGAGCLEIVTSNNSN